MTYEKLFNLAEELLERMEIAKKEAQDIKMNACDYGFYFVHCGDKEYVNPKYLSFENHCKIVQLCKFLNDHKKITNDDLIKILKMNKSRFEILIEVYEVVPNLADLARMKNDEKFISYLYAGNKFNTKELNQSI